MRLMLSSMAYPRFGENENTNNTKQGIPVEPPSTKDPQKLRVKAEENIEKGNWVDGLMQIAQADTLEREQTSSN